LAPLAIGRGRGLRKMVYLIVFGQFFDRFAVGKQDSLNGA
jgi:hypothetical protein